MILAVSRDKTKCNYYATRPHQHICSVSMSNVKRRSYISYLISKPITVKRINIPLASSAPCQQQLLLRLLIISPALQLRPQALQHPPHPHYLLARRRLLLPRSRLRQLPMPMLTHKFPPQRSRLRRRPRLRNYSPRFRRPRHSAT